ncbi:GNAT family N-acetyltransferase [Dictyobacter kobayashii]|uniref:GNAT family N-acetyltransferase n=1 Tax=Dictyobacter kobayashii TaxID=2014872 RepID=A0A402AK26_9CHLR|nr:GNAT family N-acetyltransferase [Dictyobacter kobayashii]GCE19477.1 GNAT family N-acetyltransferase [Dictyobacter kobayashii]
MPYEPLQGLVKKHTLSAVEIQSLRQLADECERYEHLHMRIEWRQLQQRAGFVVKDFLYYEDGALVGYLTLDDQGSQQNEVVGMVHPEYRRRGIFRQLLAAAASECQLRGMQQLILVCERNSRAGHAFLRAQGATLSESEHEMLLTHIPQRTAFDERLTIHKADIHEAEALIKVQSESFGDPVDATRRRVLHCLQNPTRPYYLAVFGDEEVGCHEPVGSFRLETAQEVVGIYAFGVRPDYQGRGYGRQILEEAIFILHSQNAARSIMLDVDVENSRALHLYRACGFEVRTTYDYYVLDL